jgi:type II secretory pathway pseudopilin PulG
MRKCRRIILTGFLGALCLISFSSRSSAQESQRQKQEQGAQENAYRDQSQDTQQDQQQKDRASYLGKVSEKFGKFYLEDQGKRTSYQLQNTWDAKRYVGKTVRVTGTLDTEKSILHVVAITQAPPSPSSSTEK